MHAASRRWLCCALALVAARAPAADPSPYDALVVAAVAEAPSPSEGDVKQADEQVVPASLLTSPGESTVKEPTAQQVVAPPIESDAAVPSPDSPPFRRFLSVAYGFPAVTSSETSEVASFDGDTFSSFELSKQHALHASNTLSSGWRFDGFLDRGHIGLGDEVAPRATGAPNAKNDWRSDWYSTVGVRAYSHESLYEFEGLGSILGRAFVGQYNDHFVLGPQLGIGYVAERSIWRFEAKVLGLAGYGRLDARQRVEIGEDSIPGALNRPVAIRRTTKSSEDFFAIHGEARLGIGCQVSKRVRADVTYRYMVLGPSYSASDSFVWNYPDARIELGEPTTVDQHALFVGASYLW
ncbi:MAG: hypothetical protein ACRCT8_05950 [Lacipirellulaceae bacterium]